MVKQENWRLPKKSRSTTVTVQCDITAISIVVTNISPKIRGFFVNVSPTATNMRTSSCTLAVSRNPQAADGAKYSLVWGSKEDSPVVPLMTWMGRFSSGDPGGRWARGREAPSLPVDILRRRSAGPSWICRAIWCLGPQRLRSAALLTGDAEPTVGLPGGSETPGSLNTIEVTSNTMVFDWRCTTKAGLSDMD
jgi:hypothetical protein